MATTTNYGWTTPDDTDLVKDGAAAIRTLGSSIDTSFVADEGDLLLGGASDIFEPLAIGAANTVLTSDGTTASWVAPAAGSLKLITRATYSAVANTGTTFDGVFSSTYKTYLIVIENSFAATDTDDMYMQLRYAGPTTQAATYIWTNDLFTMPTGANSTVAGNGTNQWQLAGNSATSAERFSGQYWLTNAETTTRTQMIGQGLQGNTGVAYNFYGYQYTNRTYTGFILSSQSSNISGTVAVYGLATA
jgi:hypothetical protein